VLVSLKQAHFVQLKINHVNFYMKHNNKKGKFLAVLFADISGSSALYKTKGNLQAKAIISSLLNDIQKTTLQHKGKVIKTIGDEVMVCFDRGEACLEAATAIQKHFASNSSQHYLMVSIGISYGDVILEQGDLFGETVNDAAYLTKLAKGSQIIFSESLLEELSCEQKAKAREFDWVTLKGAKKTSPIFRLYWQEDDELHNETQFLSTDIVLEQINQQILTLKSDGNEILIDPNMTPFTIGRNSDSCQLIIDDASVSREHCQITYNRGKFVLIDHSTNGCYLKPTDGLEFYLRREEFPLMEDSCLSLGNPSYKLTHPLIYIQCNNKPN